MNYRYLVGAGRRELCRLALREENRSLIDELENFMTEYYAKHCFDATKPYPGVIQVLEKLSKQGVRLTVLTNKPQEFADLTIKTLFGDFKFDIVLGDKPNLPRKPDPAGAKLIAQELGLTVEQIAYVGDTLIDMQTANRAGMYAIGVTWGFRDRQELEEHGAKVIIDQPEELYSIVVNS
jgi:phosphoglycolate phosphatase